MAAEELGGEFGPNAGARVISPRNALEIIGWRYVSGVVRRPRCVRLHLATGCEGVREIRVREPLAFASRIWRSRRSSNKLTDLSRRTRSSSVKASTNNKRGGASARAAPSEMARARHV